jgi:hypothetical protein
VLTVSEEQGKPGPRSERLCLPSADYWGWPPLWVLPCRLYGDRRFGIVGRADLDSTMDAHGVGAFANEQRRPITSAQSGGPKRVNHPNPRAVRCGGGDRPQQQRAVAVCLSGRENERANCWQGGRSEIATPGEAGRDDVAWSPGRVAVSKSLNSLLTLGWANQTIGGCSKADDASSQSRLDWREWQGPRGYFWPCAPCLAASLPSHHTAASARSAVIHAMLPLEPS